MNYTVHLGDRVLGISQLENGDPPMGVVSGLIELLDMGYRDVDTYLLDNGGNDDSGIVRLNDSSLSVTNEKGEELPSVGIYLENCTELEECHVTVLGIDYEYYEIYFKHHIETYNKQFKK